MEQCFPELLASPFKWNAKGIHLSLLFICIAHHRTVSTICYGSHASVQTGILYVFTKCPNIIFIGHRLKPRWHSKQWVHQATNTIIYQHLSQLSQHCILLLVINSSEECKKHPYSFPHRPRHSLRNTSGLHVVRFCLDGIGHRQIHRRYP